MTEPLSEQALDEIERKLNESVEPLLTPDLLKRFPNAEEEWRSEYERGVLYPEIEPADVRALIAEVRRLQSELAQRDPAWRG